MVNKMNIYFITCAHQIPDVLKAESLSHIPMNIIEEAMRWGLAPKPSPDTAHLQYHVEGHAYNKRHAYDQAGLYVFRVYHRGEEEPKSFAIAYSVLVHLVFLDSRFKQDICGDK